MTTGNDTMPRSGAQSTETGKGISTLDMVYIALCAVLIAVCSWISIPAPVPFTLQTFAVFLVLGILGGRRGTVSILVYILTGLIGAPVFSGFKGGPAVILGPTGGYIVGFLLSGLLYWGIMRDAGRKKRDSADSTRGSRIRLWAQIGASAAGLAVCYLFGTVWFYIVYLNQTGPVSVWTVLGWCVFPFILPDAAKIALAVFLSGKIRRIAHIRD